MPRARRSRCSNGWGWASACTITPSTSPAANSSASALARAFVVEPKLLLADEPTGSLDEASGEAVIGLMFELNRERGTTLVMVTHDEHLAARCGRIIRLVGGRVESSGGRAVA